MTFPLLLDLLLLHPTDAPRWTVRPLVELRTRYEQRADRDFAGARPDSRYELVGRFRPGLEATRDGGLRAVAQYQYAHTQTWTGVRNSSVEASDLFLAFVEWAQPWGTATVGRQRIHVGSGRLVGTPDWGNLGRTMDGLRFKTDRWDVYGFKLGVSSPQPESVRYFGAHYRVGDQSIGAIYKHDQADGRSVDLGTLNVSGKTAPGDWTVAYEAALQHGAVGGRDQEAWALHVKLRRQVDRRTAAFVEVNAASGGATATETRTFDNLVPSNHTNYGLMDLQGLKNMEGLSVGVEHKPDPRLALLAQGHWFRLRDASDAWYGAGGSPNRGRNGAFVDPTGQSGRNVGFELDLEATYKVDASSTVMTGFGVFEPGSFVKSLNGGSTTRQIWLFAQLGVRL